jgi:polyphosphate:AMP phosphotransferase
MFEAAELGRKVSREDYEAALPKLRADLLEAQFALRETRHPLLVVISGVEGAGKSELVNTLSQWLDIRGMEFHTFGRSTDDERMRPPWWRFWISLPPRGRGAFYLGSWYTTPILSRVLEGTDPSAFEATLTEIRLFERMLALDGAIILKFWLHLSKKDQRRRLEKLEADKATRWRVTKEDWRHHEAYDAFVRASETALRQTDTGEAPWYLVEAKNARYRDLTVGQTILDVVQARLQSAAPAPASRPAQPALPLPGAAVTILDRVDLASRMEDEAYEAELRALSETLGRLGRDAYRAQRSAVIVFEGWDAAGKGGAIRRLTAALDARSIQVISVAAPTDEERGRHYLWRFWRHIPRSGHITIYDRSWYGRVLVERVEGFARPEEWGRSFAEINDFEEHLVAHGIVLVKLFLHISPEEQLARFKERETVAYKRHKITEEDWRNREKWPAYETAVNEMVARTSTAHAPWNIIPGNDKRFARVEVLRTVAGALRRALG